MSHGEAALTAVLALEYAFFLTIPLVWLHGSPLPVATEVRLYVLAWATVPLCALGGAFLVHAKGVSAGRSLSCVALFATGNALAWIAGAAALRWGSAGGPLPQPAMLRTVLALAPLAANALATALLPARCIPMAPARWVGPLVGALLGVGLLVLALPSVPSLAQAAVATAGGAALALIPRWSRAPRGTRRAFDAAVLAAIAWLLFDPHLHFDIFHQGGFLGPISEVQRGGTVLVDAISQYGVAWIPLLAVVLDWLPWPTSYVGFTALLSIVAIAQYGLSYGLLRHLGVSLRIAAAAVAATFLMNFIGLGGALHSHPSLGPLRFGIPWLLLLCVALRARSPSRRRLSEVGESLVVVCASLWSIEAFVSTLATFAAIVVFESAAPSRRRSAGADLARRVCAAGLAVGVAHLLFALGVRFRSGLWPEWGIYLALFRVSAGLHVAARLAGGDEVRHLLPVGPWVAAVFVCAGSSIGCVVALARAKLPRQEAALALVFGATAMAVSQLAMYIGSSVPIRLAAVCVAPIFVAAYWIDRMSGQRVAFLVACTAAGLAAFQMGGLLREWIDHDTPTSLGESHAIARVTHGCHDFPRCLWDPPPGLLKTVAAEELLREYAGDGQALILLGGNGSATTEVLIRTGRRNAVPLNAPFQDSYIPRNANRVATASHGLEPGDVVIYRLGMETRTSSIYKLERRLLERVCHREFRCRRIHARGFFGVLQLEAPRGAAAR